MKRVMEWLGVLLLTVAVLGIQVYAAEEEGAETTELETAVVSEEVESPKGGMELWQEVKKQVEKVKERMMMIEKTEKDLAKTTEKKAVGILQQTLETHQDSFKKEVEALCATIDEFGKWIEAQELVEPGTEESTEEQEGNYEEEGEEEIPQE